MGRLVGRVALVVGAAIAERFAGEGAKVMIGDTQAEAVVPERPPS